MNEVLFSSKNQSWCTPTEFYLQLNKEFNFQLDPAATEKTAKCKKYYTQEIDGLAQSWNVAEGSAVFCNPPYGREIGKWVAKAYQESQHGTKIVLLIPARTDTSYFRDFIYNKAKIRFLRGRLKFEDENGVTGRCPAPFPSMLVIYN